MAEMDTLMELAKGVETAPVERSLAPTGLVDMPQEVLSGRLGEIYQKHLSAFPIAYVWPALVTSAGLLVPLPKVIRTNLYCGLVGAVGTGKSTAIERVNTVLGLGEPPVMELKSGSAEGLLNVIGQCGEPRLVFPDELGHMLGKSQIENSSFPYVLNSVYYNDHQKLTIARGKEVQFNCSLSVAGGVVEDKFDDLFGKASTGGLYDRFIFGQCPTGYSYLWRPPFDGQPEELNPVPVTVHPSVWDERDAWVKEIPGMTGRIAEHALRVATICASLDGNHELGLFDLAPAQAFAEYQVRVRALLKPNPGENFEARAAHKFLAYLQRHASDGQWVSKRTLLRDTRGYDLGPSICDKALAILEYNGDIQQTDKGRQSLVRLIP